MKDSIRNDLKEICYQIIENKGAESLSEQLTQVQMLYERLVVLNYLEENSEPVPASAQAPTEKIEETPKPKATQVPETDSTGKEEPLKFGVPENERENIPAETQNRKSEEKISPTSSEKSPSSESKAERAEAEGQASLNDRLGQGTIDIGLNDRIAFVKHLFGGEQQDFNRVLSQLNTFSSLQETEQFINQMVKPDYDWTDKEEYEERLMELVRKRYGED